jgi:hypothetical protein
MAWIWRSPEGPTVTWSSYRMGIHVSARAVKRTAGESQLQVKCHPPGSSARPKIASGTPIHYLAFNLKAGAEYVCIPSMVRDPGT